MSINLQSDYSHFYNHEINLNYEDDNVFLINDFIYNSGNILIAKYFYNPIINKIENNYNYKTNYICGTNLLYVPDSSISNACSIPYITNKKWDYVITDTPVSGTIYASSTINISDINNVSGEYLSIYGRNPTYLGVFNKKHEYFSVQDISYNEYGSILILDESGVLQNSVFSNWKTNCLKDFDSKIFYGGLNLTNNIEILSYSVNEYISQYIKFVDLNSSAGVITNRYDCSGGLSSFLIGNYLFEWIFNGFNTFTNSEKKKKDYYNERLTINKDSIVFLIGSSKNINGFIDVNYTFYNGTVNGITDWIPRGYVLTSGITTKSYTVPQGGSSAVFAIEIPNRVNVSNQYRRKISVSEDLPYSSGSLRIYATSTINDIQNILNPFSPYGIYCTGNNIFDMMIYVSGHMNQTDLNNALNYQDFTYNFAKLNLEVINNGIYTKTSTHGQLDNSGNIIWSDNHGNSLIKYSKYLNTGIIDNLYDSPNHFGEIYRIDYDSRNKNSVFTGNLVNDFSVNKYESRLFESGVYIYDSGGNIIDSYVNYIPTGIYNSAGNSDILESVFNKKSLEYIQTLSANLTCSEEIAIPGNLLQYTGVYPNFSIGVVNIHGSFIDTTGVK